ncbi:MAG: 4-(cytidine 5'-diphospho)-2-C-methyl-D-erythritol kinase [Proteobacteria bacterium]|nr:4-(cytidine 5'-diphospho)-2-C-methyl-D-erythritol kinase [Pseudomonadota bacterium]MDE3207943.1 4-(cytidine 5'-diphospho)-2-C-methyl-D-erythritol kinase [Pseudomonadota bacterium]
MPEHLFLAPAKLNLSLRVMGRRPDGYHLLDSLFRLVDVSDKIYISVMEDGRIERAQSVPGVEEADDLCLLAARRLKVLTNCPLGARIRLRKTLPIGGGLGGGSSDAATVLIALNHLWKTHLSRDSLLDIALTLGADVPFFVYGINARVQGIGERFDPVVCLPAWYVVLAPDVFVSTREIFESLGLTVGDFVDRMTDFPGPMRNELQDIAIARHPQIARCLEWLMQYGEARMTGSGACVFAEFDREDEARRVFLAKPRGMRGFMAQGLDRHPHYELID